jgi:VCBS repeat-containing protein
MNYVDLLRRHAPVTLALLSTSAFAVPVATDDGSTGTPFGTQNEDALLDTSILGSSVLTNDTGSNLIFESSAISSSAGAPVTLNADGTFVHDPRSVAAFQALAAGSSIADTFSYTIYEDPFTTGPTETLNPTTGVNDRGWTPLPAAAAATGTNRPIRITNAYPFSGTQAVANDYQQLGAYHGADMTLEFWITRTAVNTNEILWETGGAGQGSSVLLNNDGTVTFAVKNNNNTTARSVVTGTTVLVPGQWYHIVASVDINQSGTNDLVSLFINGAADGSDSAGTLVDFWSGTDDAGVGGISGSSVGADDANPGVFENNYGAFSGQLGLFNFYTNTAYDATAALANYNAYANPVTSTGTVTVSVTGLNDAPGALDDVAGSTPENGSLVSTQNLLVNDGPTRVNDDAPDTPVVGYDARRTAGSG